MMKTIIATIKPPHLDNIRSGRKAYEVRKTIPKVELPFRVLCCESGSGGKIKAEFTVDAVISGIGFRNARCAGTCLDWGQLRDYIGEGQFHEWHMFDRITRAMAKHWEKKGKRPAYRWAEIIARGWRHEE